MEVVVLPPQDILKRHHHHQRRRNSNPNLNPNPTHQHNNRSTRKRPTSNSPPKVGPVKAQPQPTGPTPQIRILKRGEDLSETKPVMGPMIGGFYAGSACVTSPAPSELPLPAFFTRTCGMSMVNDDNNQKIATDLRRVLKLF